MPESFPELGSNGCANIFWFRMKNRKPAEYSGCWASSSTILVSGEVTDLNSIRLRCALSGWQP